MKASKFTEAQKAFITKHGEEGSRSTSCSAGGIICAKLWPSQPRENFAAELQHAEAVHLLLICNVGELAKDGSPPESKGLHDPYP